MAARGGFPERGQRRQAGDRLVSGSIRAQAKVSGLVGEHAALVTRLAQPGVAGRPVGACQPGLVAARVLGVGNVAERRGHGSIRRAAGSAWEPDVPSRAPWSEGASPPGARSARRPVPDVPRERSDLGGEPAAAGCPMFSTGERGGG